MAHLLSIPQNVMIHYLFPRLDHNDLLRLRRVSKQTKAFANAYLWTPQPGHQGKWELRIDSTKEDQTLEAFLQMGLPPPSRLHIANEAEEGPSEQRSFFEDEHLDEFMRRYSKYVTNLRLDKLFIPFTSAKELGFYESLVNLNKLRCNKMITVGGSTQFEEKTRRAEGRFLIRPTFKTLKIFKLDFTDCMDSMWNFINGVSNNLEQLLHPFYLRAEDEDSEYWSGEEYMLVNFAPVRELIERLGGMKKQVKLLYDWRYLFNSKYLELLKVFRRCHQNGVMIKNLWARHIDCLICEENGWGVDEVVDPETGQWNSVGCVIHSLMGVTNNTFLIDLPALEEISFFSADRSRIRPSRWYGHPEWSNLRKINVTLDYYTANTDFLWEHLELHKLEELCLTFRKCWKMAEWKFPIHFPMAKELGNYCVNLKKLTVNGDGDDNWFIGLWEGLPLLEDVTLNGCRELTNRGFVGNGVGASGPPVFLNLKKLKHLTILNLEVMPGITNAAFRSVFRHLKLTSFKLSSDKPIRSVSWMGIEKLLSGRFARTIQKLDMNQLQLEISEEELKQMVSWFRSSKML